MTRFFTVLAALALLLCASPAFAGGPGGISDGLNDRFLRVYTGTTEWHHDSLVPYGTEITLELTATNRRDSPVTGLSFGGTTGFFKGGGYGFYVLAIGDYMPDNSTPGAASGWGLSSSVAVPFIPVPGSLQVTDENGAIFPTFGSSETFLSPTPEDYGHLGIGAFSVDPGKTIVLRTSYIIGAVVPESPAIALLFLATPLAGLAPAKRRTKN